LESDQRMSILRRYMEQRANRQGLGTTLEKLAYVQNHFSAALTEQGKRALYVGVGNGHDAVYCLLRGAVQQVVGVDPYLSEQGNPADRTPLMQLVDECGLGRQIEIVVSTIEDYLRKSNESFSAVVMFDVLHHIFPHRQPLWGGEHQAQAVALAGELYKHLDPGGILLVQETEPWGLRQILTRLGVMGGKVDYGAKQHWRQWSRIMAAAGFTLERRVVYIPWALRRMKAFLNNGIGLYTVSDRNIMVFRKAVRG
jgi:SAM-dependent methyltransferase